MIEDAANTDPAKLSHKILPHDDDGAEYPLSLSTVVWLAVRKVHDQYRELRDSFSQKTVPQDALSDLWGDLYDAHALVAASKDADCRPEVRATAEALGWLIPEKVDLILELRYEYYRGDAALKITPCVRDDEYSKPQQTPTEQPAGLHEPEAKEKPTTPEQGWVDNLIERVRRDDHYQVNYNEIVQVAGYKDLTEFRKFRQGKLKPQSKPYRQFKRVLAMPTPEIMQLLKK